ncbi:hypothetical protein ACFQ4K_32580 [Tistrella bauzanensis]
MSASPSETRAAPVGARHQTARLLLLVGLIGLIGLAGLTLVDVLGRWLLNTPCAGSATSPRWRCRSRSVPRCRR